MGIDILLKMMENFCEAVREFAVNYFLSMIDMSTAFNCVAEFESQVGVDLTRLFQTVYKYGLCLLTLKFVWKLFDTYLLGADGNEDADPMIMVVNFAKALFLSLSFGLLFTYMMDIGSSVATDMMNSLKMTKLDMSNVFDMVLSAEVNSIGGFFLYSIYGILGIVLAVKFIQSAIQLVYLRTGIVFSVVGLLDSDGGVFKPYMKKFFQVIFAVIIQVLSFKLSIFAFSKVSWLWAFALMGLALKAPAWLSEFTMQSNQGGGKLQTAIYTMSMFRFMK